MGGKEGRREGGRLDVMGVGFRGVRAWGWGLDRGASIGLGGGWGWEKRMGMGMGMRMLLLIVMEMETETEITTHLRIHSTQPRPPPCRPSAPLTNTLCVQIKSLRAILRSRSTHPRPPPPFVCTGAIFGMDDPLDDAHAHAHAQ